MKESYETNKTSMIYEKLIIVNVNLHGAASCKISSSHTKTIAM